MDPIYLVRKDDPEQEVIAFACGKCGQVFAIEDVAREHCEPALCACGKPRIEYFTVCRECREVQIAEMLKAKRDKAKVVELDENTTLLYWDEKDEYFDPEGCFEALCEEFVCDIEGAKAQTIWVCEPYNLKLPDAEDVIQMALDRGEHHENARDDVSDEAFNALQIELAAWGAKYGSEVTSFMPDETRRVEFPEKWWDDYKKELET